MKFVILDIYPNNKNYRISKDQNGSYGTGNDYGDNLFSTFLKFFVLSSIFVITITKIICLTILYIHYIHNNLLILYIKSL